MKTFTTTYTSPLGSIVIETDGQAITSLRFRNEQVHADSTTQEKDGEEAATALPIIAETIQWLDDDFAGKLPCNVPRLNPQGTAFQKRVWTALLTIPYGRDCQDGRLQIRAGGRTSRRSQPHCIAHSLPPCHRRTRQIRRLRIRHRN